MKITAYSDELPLQLSGAAGIIASNYSTTSIGSNTPLIESGSGSPGSGPQAAAWDHVHPEFSSGSSSFGSNSTRVALVSAAGASSSNSRADHVHDGIGTVTASSSNSLNRGTLNLRAGTGIALALSNTDGGSGFDTATITNIAAGGSGGGGGSGLTGSYIGYNTIGGSWETATVRRQLCKSVTLGSAAQFLSIDAYLRPSVDNVSGMYATLLMDNAGAPGVLIAGIGIAASTSYLSNSSSMPGAGRWFSFPIPAYVAAGTYWICIMIELARYDIAYDGSGTDQHFTASQFIVTGAYPSSWAITTGTRKYSLRARVLT